MTIILFLVQHSQFCQKIRNEKNGWSRYHRPSHIITSVKNSEYFSQFDWSEALLHRKETRKMGFGDYPAEYNPAKHGPYDPARYYGKREYSK